MRPSMFFLELGPYLVFWPILFGDDFSVQILVQPYISEFKYNTRRMEQLHQVIIIGAGISGLGASRELFHAKVPHIILESRDRFGGRIHYDQFAGITVDMGATFIHNPCEDNQIYKVILEEYCDTIEAPDQEEFYYEGQGILEDDVVERMEQLVEKAEDAAEQKAEQTQEDISLEEAYQEFIEEQLDGEQPLIRDSVLWKLKIEGNVQGAELSELSAKKPSIEQKKNDLLVCGGGYPMLFKRLYDKYQLIAHFNTRVLSIDYSGPVIRLKTNNGVYSAKKVISSLPLGILKAGRVQFIPHLPEPYQDAINSIGMGNENKLFVHFSKPFWRAQKGYLNFITKSKNNRYPIGFIYPNDQGKHILLVFVAGKAGYELGEWSDNQIAKDFGKFLTNFVDQSEFQIEEAMMSRWHKDEDSLGSYCFNKVGTRVEHFEQFRKPIDNKLWFVGEHTHPKLSSYAHGAYETGLWGAQEVVESLKGGNEEFEGEGEDIDENDD